MLGAVLAAALWAMVSATPALAYTCTNCHFNLRGHDNMGKTCSDCHHKWASSGLGDPHRIATDTLSYTMPHGGFGDATDKCTMCHMVHEAASDSRLLPGATIFDTCMTCHNQTGAKGVYGTITGRGLTVAAEHSTETTTAPPGGSAAAGYFTCDSCHTPHGNTLMADWVSEDAVSYAGNRREKLLRDDVGGAPEGTYTTYGARWCAACHDRRVPLPTVHNHPVDTQTAYDLSGITTGDPDPTRPAMLVGAWTSNGGYVFDPVPAVPDGRVSPRPAAPICQQCHEDARDVETAFAPIDSGSGYSLGAWGPTATANPQFFTFPHQGTNPSFVVETADDLCLNCHPTGQLP